MTNATILKIVFILRVKYTLIIEPNSNFRLYRIFE